MKFEYYIEDETLLGPTIYRMHYYATVDRKIETPLIIVPDLNNIIRQYDALIISATASTRSRSSKWREFTLNINDLQCYSKLKIKIYSSSIGCDLYVGSQGYRVRANSTIEISGCSTLKFQTIRKNKSSFSITGECIDISSLQQIKINFGYHDNDEIQIILDGCIVESIVQ